MKFHIFSTVLKRIADQFEFRSQLLMRDRIVWQRVNRFVFVCTGNICRSPYGAEAARRAGIPVASGGIDTHDDLPAYPMATKVALGRGVDLDTHRTSRWQGMKLTPGDLVIAMDGMHMRGVRESVRRSGAQLTLISVWCSPPSVRVPDPYGKGADVFERCFDDIDVALRALQERYVKSRGSAEHAAARAG